MAEPGAARNLAYALDRGCVVLSTIPVGPKHATLEEAEYIFNHTLKSHSPRAPYVTFFRNNPSDADVKGVVVLRHMEENSIHIIRCFKYMGGAVTGRRCSGCKVFYFESAEQQKLQWSQHKRICQALTPHVVIRVQ